MKSKIVLAALAAAALAAAHTASAAPVFSSANNDSDIHGVAHDYDANCVNPWGLVPGPEGALHVNNNATGVTSHYGRYGALLGSSSTPQFYTIPSLSGTGVGRPTGIVLNKFSFDAVSGADDFQITGTSGASGKSHYLIATEDGLICGYNDNVQLNSAVVGYTGSSAGYTGVALSFETGSSGALLGTAAAPVYHHRLYAANFRNGTVDVFDSSFTPVVLSGTAFVDPNLTGTNGLTWSPFNVKAVSYIGKNPGEKTTVQLRILVAFALHSGTAPMLDVPGPGNGAVAVFTPNGQFLPPELVPAGGLLNSPWGMAISHQPVPSKTAKAYVLVGNHGDGQINAYAFAAGAHEGDHIITLRNDQGTPLAFDGLWALHFGPKLFSYNVNAVAAFLGDIYELYEDGANLYFTAGLFDEDTTGLDTVHGLVGRITVPHVR